MSLCDLAQHFSLFSTVENGCGNVEASYFLLFHTPYKGVEEWKRKDAAKNESRTGRTIIEAAPIILTTLPEPLAAQLVREMVRLRSPKVDSGKVGNALLLPKPSHAPADWQAALRTRREFRGNLVRPPVWPFQKTGAGNSRRRS